MIRRLAIMLPGCLIRLVLKSSGAKLGIRIDVFLEVGKLWVYVLLNSSRIVSSRATIYLNSLSVMYFFWFASYICHLF